MPDSPIKVDVQNAQQPVPPLLVPIAAHRVEKVRHDDIGADDWIAGPLGAEVDDAVRGVHEHVLAEDPAVSRLGKPLAGEDTQ